MRIGIDIDGVLADFIGAFNVKLAQVENRFPYGCGPSAYVPGCWDYAQIELGYTQEQVDTAWNSINPLFWNKLQALPAAQLIVPLLDGEHDVYFVTNRHPKPDVKLMSEMWLENMGWVCPTVLLTARKGPVCRALDIECFIDDRIANVLDIQSRSPQTRAYLLDCPWNRRERTDVGRVVENVGEFLRAEGLV